MSDTDAKRFRVSLKQVVREPGFNYRRHLVDIPDDIRKHIRSKIAQSDGSDEAEGSTAAFDWKVLDEMVAAHTELNEAERDNISSVLRIAESIHNGQLINPLTVRESSAATESAKTYFLVAGARRFMALELLGHAQIEVKIVKGDMHELKRLRFIENAQRKNPDEIEEAEAIQNMLEESGVSQDRLAKQLGVSAAFISQRLSLIKKAVGALRDGVAKGTITSAVARSVALLPKETQEDFVADLSKRIDEGHRVKASDVQREVDDLRRKAGKGPKARAVAHKKGIQGADDGAASELKAQIDVAANAGYDFSNSTLRPLREVKAMLGTLLQKQKRAKTPESTAAAKAQIALVEWTLGMRKTL